MAEASRPSPSLVAFAMGLGCLSGLVSGWPSPLWRSWGLQVQSQLLNWAGPQPPPPGVIVVAVDDASLQQGQWFRQQAQPPAWSQGIDQLPWPRRSYAELIHKLRAAGARAVAVNLLFEGPSDHGPGDDQALARELQRQRGRVVLAAEMLEPEDRQGAGGLSLSQPLPLFQQAVGGRQHLGLTNMLLGEDAEVGPHPEAYGTRVLIPHHFPLHQSLPTALLQAAGLRSRQADAERHLRPYGPEGQLPRLSAWEVLDPQRWARHPLKAQLKGALVLIGPTLEQGERGHGTAFGPLSGVELMATATANSLDGTGLAPWPRPAWGRALAGGLPVLAIGLLALAGGRLRWRLGWSLLGLGAVVGTASAGLWLGHRSLPLLAPAGSLVLLGSGLALDGYWREERERRRLRRTFERYVAPAVVAEILQDREAAEGILRGRTLPVTVLFSDLKGFTALTQLRSQEGRSADLVEQLNTYLGAMVEVINAHGGTVDKFIGDAVMAVFGSPRSRGTAEEAEQAVRCALAMGQRLTQLNQQWQSENTAPLASGVGIASGDAVVGQIGSPQRLDFTVIGDTVNLASRLESLTRSLNTPVLFNRRTAELVQAHLPVQALGEQPIKGMGPVPVFRPA